MDRSAVIRSMDRKHLRKVSDPYPFEGLIKADHKRFTVTLIQCDSLCLLGTLQLQMLQVKAQTHAHRHTHTTQLGWILPQDGFTIALCQTWAGGGKHMFGVWIGYGTGYGTKSVTFPDYQKV